MYRTPDWQEAIELIAGCPLSDAKTKESWLAKVARLSGSRFWHVKALYEGDLTDPKYSVAYKILNAAKLAKTKAKLEEARRDAKVVASFFDSHAQALANIDESFHRPAIDAFVEAARLISGRNSS